MNKVKQYSKISILDLDPTDLTIEFRHAIKNQEPIYRDTISKEHLYSIIDEDELKEQEYLHQIENEFRDLMEICAKEDCSYYRIISH